MNVLVVEPGYAPYEKEIVGLEQMQATVGGLIEAIYPYEEDNVAIVCNEEGLINGMEFNRSVPRGYGGVFGTFFVCGLGKEDFCSLTPEQMEKFKKTFHRAEILLGARGNDPVTLKVEPKQKKPTDTPQKPPKRPER